MTYASYITSLRIVLIIPIIILTYAQTTLFNFLALFLFIIAGLTDYFDGFIARKINEETSLGALLDLLADKLLVCLILIWLIFLNPYLSYIIPALIIITRELVISALRQFLIEKKKLKGLKVSYIAKSKTTLQIICISLIIISPEFGNLFALFSFSLLWVTSLLSIFSLYDYLSKWSKNIF
tara:strand:- start:119 stop:661 length:543 start_codon:yes stop_codon:yes gene_type:complete